MLDLVAAFIALTTLLTYVNYRFIRLPPTIGVMATALVFSLIVQGLSELGYPILEVEMQEIIRRIDFSEVLMTWFLPALLFAGALHVDLSDLRSYKWPIGLLATAGVLIATFVIGGLAYYTFPLFGWQVDFIYCLLFGALISPTDPIAVLGILKSAGAPKPLATTIVGESLFNDGTAVVVFAIILGILQLGEAPTVSATAILFVQEAIGGVLFGAVLGYGVFVMMRGIDQYQVEVMLTLALVIGGAALAARLHVSAPIAMVVAGLIIGNHGRHYAMSDETRRYVDKFWELIDEILNALLFALIGLELLLLPFSWLHVAAAFALGGAVLVSRLLTVGPAILILRRFRGANRQ
ncbi:sodium:proton antiporter, partial [Pseudomonas aeruginosa]|nr:sodium:proton antiporter [Pseudomonas aeruginosa]